VGHTLAFESITLPQLKQYFSESVLISFFYSKMHSFGKSARFNPASLLILPVNGIKQVMGKNNHISPKQNVIKD